MNAPSVALIGGENPSLVKEEESREFRAPGEAVTLGYHVERPRRLYGYVWTS